MHDRHKSNLSMYPLSLVSPLRRVEVLTSMIKEKLENSYKMDNRQKKVLFGPRNQKYLLF